MTLMAIPTRILLAFALLLVCGSAQAQDSPHIGLKIRTLTAELRKERNLAEDVKGVLVTAVVPGSPAQEKGIVVGDVIVEAGGKPVATAKQLAKQIAAAPREGTVLLQVLSPKGERRSLSIAIPKPRTAPTELLPGPK